MLQLPERRGSFLLVSVFAVQLNRGQPSGKNSIILHSPGAQLNKAHLFEARSIACVGPRFANRVGRSLQDCTIDVQVQDLMATRVRINS